MAVKPQGTPEVASYLGGERGRSAVLDRTERIDVKVEASAGHEADAGRLRRRETIRSVIDRGDQRLVDRREHLRHADGQGGDVPAGEREPEEQRSEHAGCEATSIEGQDSREEP